MAKAGWNVHVLEKHDTAGGRARQLKEAGFVFDMGPSWYWMPDVFERYFRQFGKNVEAYYSLQRLNPSYRVYWQDGAMDIPADLNDLKILFETIEPGSSRQLDKFLEEAAYKYKVGIQKLVFKPGQSVTELLDKDVIGGLFRLDIFTSMQKHVRKYFQHPKLIQLLEFPVLFLGATAKDIPALYSLMNYADIVGGTWYPGGGMHSIVRAMYELAVELGVKFHFGHNVKKVVVENGIAKNVIADISGKNEIARTVSFDADVVIGGADYHFIETQLLEAPFRTYDNSYWNSRVMAPSCILYYVGLNKKLNNFLHHSLFFDVSFEQHADEIYTTRIWPVNPLFYVSATSVTDPDVAPEGCENLFLLIPVASGLKEDTETLRDHYFNMIIQRMEQQTGESILDAVIYRKSFCITDFVNEYNSFKGNAYGLANTLLQTAILKPSCRSKKVKNLFYAGQLTVPGPGVPPSLISGELVSAEVVKHFGI